MEKIGDYLFIEDDENKKKRFNINHISMWTESINKSLTYLCLINSGDYITITVPFEEFDKFMMGIINKTVGL